MSTNFCAILETSHYELSYIVTTLFNKTGRKSCHLLCWIYATSVSKIVSLLFVTTRSSQEFGGNNGNILPPEREQRKIKNQGFLPQSCC